MEIQSLMNEITILTKLMYEVLIVKETSTRY